MTGVGEPRNSLHVAVAAALTLLTPQAQAQAQKDAASAISISAEDLDDALRSLARKTGTQVVFDPLLVSGRTVPAVVGAKTSEQALRTLLANTGLTYRSTAPGTYTILAQAAATPSPRTNVEQTTGAGVPVQENATLVEEVVVTAQRREEALQDVPISISVLPGTKLDSSSVEGVSEALNAVPAVVTTETYLGGGTNIAIRGVGASFPLFAGSSAVSY